MNLRAVNLPALCLLIPLAACETSPSGATPPAGPGLSAAGLAMIEVSSGSPFSGLTTTRIYADGTMVTDTDGGGRKPQHSQRQGDPSAFAAAAAVIATEGLRTKAAMKPQPDMCLDYGSDAVRADPPIAGFDQVYTGCPDAAVTALMDHVLAALAQ